MKHTTKESPIQFQILADVPSPEIQLLWRDLESRSDCAFFLSWDWIGCWIAETGISLQVLVGREAGRVVLLGLLAASHRRGRIPFRIPGASLHTTGHPDQDVVTVEYNGFLVARDCQGRDTARAEDAAIRFLLLERSGSIDELHLRNVSRTYVAMDAAGPRPGGLRRDLVWSKPSWRVDLEAIRASGRRYADSLSGNTRQQIRRSMRLYEKQGKLVATRARDVPEALAFLDGLKSLHQPYWIGRGEPGAFAFPFFDRFQRRLIETCHPHGGVELVRITRGDTAIGYLYNLIYRRQIYSYQCGFLFEADPKLKPGLVSHFLCIEMHEREGDRVYDFMAGDNRYKSNLGMPGPDMHYIVLQRPTLAIRLENGLRSLRDGVRSLIRSA
jgi:CelD/BcsL family acetyltransferase involved in cellulose biosynthesis